MHFSFHEIVNKDRWQTIQNHFSEVFKVSLRTVDRAGALLAQPTIWGGACSDFLGTTPEGKIHYQNCLRQVLEACKKNWKEGYICPAGFYNFAIPLSIKEEVIAYLVVGPVIIGKRRDNSVYRTTAKTLGIDEGALLGIVHSMKTFTFYGIYSIIEFLNDICLYIFQFGYQNVRLRTQMPDTATMLETIHDFYIERVLGALLDVSCSFTGAERGSVMLLDAARAELYIKIARGLDGSIIQKTRLKLGEGLAGVAAAEQRRLVINDELSDQHLRQRCHNPKIKNAIIIPLRADNTTIGVLNISTYKDHSDKFGSHSLATLDKLAALVEATLSGLPIDLLPA